MPSLNTGNAILSNPIKVDSSYNVGIGGAASGSFKLQVTGTGNFTGALSGTSATFSGNVNVGTNIAQLLPITTTNFQILTGCYYDGSNIIATATSGTRIISNAGSFTFNNFTGATIGSSVSDTPRLTIASTGAATFSSSVTTTQLITKSGSGAAALFLKDASAVDKWEIGHLSNSLYFYNYTRGGTDLTLNGSTGAATFSSSVTANGLYANAGNSARFYRSANDYYWGVNNDSNNYLNFGTFAANGTAYGTNPKMIILDNGNVGIGTNSPSAGLEVVTDSGAFNALRLVSNRAQSSGTDVAIAFRYLYDTTNYATGGLIVAGKDNTTSGSQSGNLQFYTNNAGTVAERMRITSGGNVGIGTTTPVQPLQLGQVSVISEDANSMYIGANFGSSTGGNYIKSQYANQIHFDSATGVINFKVAGSGTAGNAISYTTAMSITSAGLATFSSSAAVGDSISLLGELYWGPFSSGQKVRAYPTGSSGSATLNFAFWNGSAWGIQGSLTSAGVWSTTGGGTSDARTKEEIDYNFDNGIESILKLQPTKFKFKIAPNKQRRGFIAQDVLEVIPDLVLGDGEKEDGTYGLDYDGILALAVKAIQELNQTIQNQQQQINSLINR